MKLLLKRRSLLPGFGITWGISTTYLSLVVLIPLAALAAKSASLSPERFWETVTSPRALASYRISFLASLAGACLNALFGSILAWVLVRYRFPGRRIVDALVDLPFALPTAVSGIALTAIYSENGWLGGILASLGIRAAFAPAGVVIALTFIGLPFVVRTLQPAIEDIDREVEEAAASLGASRWKCIRLIIFPLVRPALLTGFALSFARALGEYGSVIFISGNMPMETEITPLLIAIKLEQYDYGGAAALAVVMLGASFLLLLFINFLQRFSVRYRLAEGT